MGEERKRSGKTRTRSFCYENPDVMGRKGSGFRNGQLIKGVEEERLLQGTSGEADRG